MPWTTTNTAKGDNKLYSDAKGVVPSLDLRFASQKNLNDYMTGTPLVDHQRSMSGSNLSPGTFVNSSGLIETAKVNLVTYSEEINFWSSSGILPFGSGSVVDATEAPNGTQTADLITSANATSLQYVQNITNYAGPHIFSVYLKDNGARYAQISTNQHGSTYIVNIDLQTGVTSPAGLSENVGNGWYRVFYTLLTLDGSGDHRITLVDSITAGRNSSFTGDGTSGIYIWGAQLEEGATATTYIPTTNVPSAAPRFDHNPTTGESLGLLIEESRTNLALRSEEFDNPTWQRNNSTITANTVTAPNGTQTADTIEMLAVGVNDGVYQAISVANGTYTYSFWARADSNKTIKARIYSSVFEVSFNLTSTWQRFSVTESLTVSNAYPLIKGLTVGDQFYIWGAQLELGSFPTSYIPTTGTALTRSADVASISGSNFGSWYNQSEGTFFTNLGSQGLGLPTRIQAIETGTNNRIQLRDGQSYCFNATQQFYLFHSSALKEAFAFSGSSTSIANSGIIVATAGTANLPNCSKLELGSRSNLDYLNGTIFRLTYFPDRLPDATLQAITA